MKGFFRISSRFLLLIAFNIVILITVSILTAIICSALGISLQDSPFMFYIIFYSLIGFGGAFVSLQFSIFFAKRTFGVKILDKQKATSSELKLIQKVEALSRKAGISIPPQVGIYNSPEVNAFATGPRKNKSLVALSTGLLENMNEDEAEGVIGHELAHIANGDMVTMTLLMGLVNTMVFILARVATTFLFSLLKIDHRRSFFLQYFVWNLFMVFFSLIGAVLILNPFSRRREYKADKGGAFLSGRDKMIQALKKLKTLHSAPVQKQTAQYNAFKISTGSKKPSSIQLLFSTHPPLDSRILRLQKTPIVSSPF